MPMVPARNRRFLDVPHDMCQPLLPKQGNDNAVPPISAQADERETLQQFYETLSARLGEEVASKLQTAIRVYRAEPRSVGDVLALLRGLAESAWKILNLWLHNSYVNREMGPAREDYIQILKRRFDDADALFQAVLALAEELGLNQARADISAHASERAGGRTGTQSR